MAIKYWDYILGNDGTGDGSASKPFKTLNTASTNAGANGEVRCAGRPLITLPNALWTQDSNKVQFEAAHNLSVGNFIRCDANDMYPSFRVASITGNEVTLAKTWYGETGTYATYKIDVFPLNEAQTLAYDGQLLSFGWRLSDESRPSDYISAFSRNVSAIIFNPGRNNWIIDTGNRLIFFGNGLSSDIFVGTTTPWGFANVNGILEIADMTSGSCITTTTRSYVYYKNVVTSGGQYSLRAGSAAETNATMFVENAELWESNTYPIYGHGGRIVVGHATMRGISGSINNWGGVLEIGELDLRTAVPLSISQRFRGTFSVGILTGVAPTSISHTITIGGPANRWRNADGAGLVDKVGGRGGGYGLRFDPASKAVPCMTPIATMVKANKSITLRFYTYYTGTELPECWIVFKEPNGLVNQHYTFVPPNGTGWSSATQQTITFEGTTLQDGSLQMWICVQDNTSANALVYIDDIEVIQS